MLKYKSYQPDKVQGKFMESQKEQHRKKLDFK